MVMVAALLTGCPSFPDPVKPGEDSGAGDLGQIIDSSQPDQPLPDLLIQPDAPPIEPDAPQVDTKKKQPQGALCGADVHCQSGFCSNYTCCDTACKGTCKACNLTGSVGVCSDVPDGDDPRHDCNATLKDTCSDDGQCDGKGACRKWAAGTKCGTAQCSTSNHELTNVKACDGSGSCASAPDVKCDPFSCSSKSDQCYTTCTDGDEGYTCQGWYGCDSNQGVCYTSCSKDSHCVNGGECKSGNCQDED